MDGQMNPYTNNIMTTYVSQKIYNVRQLLFSFHKFIEIIIIFAHAFQWLFPPYTDFH
jgi:hypothetical protein